MVQVVLPSGDCIRVNEIKSMASRAFDEFSRDAVDTTDKHVAKVNSAVESSESK